MNSPIERFGALLKGETPDTVPIVCNLLDQGAQELGVSIHDYYQSGELVAKGQLAMQKKYGYDTLLGMFYSALEAEILGCKNIIYASDGPPNVGHLLIRSPSDILNFKLPDNFDNHPRFTELIKTIKILKQESRGSSPVLGVVTASFSLPAMLMGIGEWLNLALWGDTSLRDRLLKLCSAFCAAEIETLRNAGADMIVYVNPVASASVISPDIFRKIALQWIINDLSQVGYGGVVYFNGGGKINPILADIQQNSAIAAYYLNPFDDIREARDILGSNPLIVGAINDIRLLDWSEQEIDDEVANIMNAGKESGGFIFGTLLMPYKIPEKNIYAMVASAMKYGCYEKKICR